MNTQLTSKEITELNYLPQFILTRAIEGFYQVYSQMYLPDSIKYDLNISVGNLVRQYFHLIKSNEGENMRATREASFASYETIENIIRNASIGKTEAVYDRLIKEAIGWHAEIFLEKSVN